MNLSPKEQACFDIAVRIREKHIQEKRSKGYSEEQADEAVPLPELNKVDGSFRTLWNQLRPGANQMYISYDDDEVIQAATEMVAVLFGDNHPFQMKLRERKEGIELLFGSDNKSVENDGIKIRTDYAPGHTSIIIDMIPGIVIDLYGDKY